MRWNKCGILNMNQNQAGWGGEGLKKINRWREGINDVCVCNFAFLCGHNWFCMWSPRRLYQPMFACVLCFCQLPLFVGQPSHLFHGYICDLLGSDWYGNIIIQARILSLPSLALSPLSPSLLSISPPTNFLSRVSTQAVLLFRIASSLTWKRPTPLFSSAPLCSPFVV